MVVEAAGAGPTGVLQIVVVNTVTVPSVVYVMVFTVEDGAPGAPGAPGEEAVAAVTTGVVVTPVAVQSLSPQFVIVAVFTVPLEVYVIVFTVDDGVGSVEVALQIVVVKVFTTPLVVYVIVLTVELTPGAVDGARLGGTELDTTVVKVD